MTRRIKALLLAATAAASLPVVATPAEAYRIDWGCSYLAMRDVTDEQDRRWIELTYSSFAGSPDVTEWRVTCWLQTGADLGVGEIANTRHTCAGIGPAGACANPVVFEVNASDAVRLCQHVSWVDSGASDPTTASTDLLHHLLRDVLSTGGVVNTLGGTNGLVDTAQLAVNSLVDTLQAIDPAEYLPGSPVRHTLTPDWDEDASNGVQCIGHLETAAA